MSFLSSRNSIIVLTVFTALVHLVLGVPDPMGFHGLHRVNNCDVFR
jgi:hypothetical protein